MFINLREWNDNKDLWINLSQVQACYTRKVQMLDEKTKKPLVGKTQIFADIVLNKDFVVGIKFSGSEEEALKNAKQFLEDKIINA